MTTTQPTNESDVMKESPTAIYSPKEFVRVCVNTAAGKRYFWADRFKQNGEQFSFRVVDRDGDTTNRFFFGMGDDLVSVRPARLNLFFGAME